MDAAASSRLAALFSSSLRHLRAVAELRLVGHLLLFLLELLQVRQEISGQRSDRARAGDRLEVLVKPVDERDACGDLQLGDLLVGDVVQILEHAADRVAVGSDQHCLPALEGAADRLVPIRQAAVHGVLQALRERDVRLGNVGVLVVIPRPVLRVRLDGRRRRGVRAAPLAHLLRAVLGDCLLLVETREPPVHPLVQPPVLVHRNVLLPSDLQHNLERLLRPLEQTGEGDVDLEALLPHLSGALRRLVLPESSELHVRPAGE
mmetsp:Transcript_5147/g.13155  ORF Transcript_5147/g.13155 Transcript_5147/m.13155 type:complete len:262 (+) Transcript_5147:205-990(+)